MPAVLVPIHKGNRKPSTSQNLSQTLPNTNQMFNQLAMSASVPL